MTTTSETKDASKMAKKIELAEVNLVQPYAHNARTHSADQIQQIIASIVEYGWTNPILVDKDMGIIAGHGRFMAACELGYTHVPIIKLDHLSDVQRRAYIIADNKLALNAGWDEDFLADEIIALRDDNFDMDLLGFNDDELLDILPESIPENSLDEANKKKDKEKKYILEIEFPDEQAMKNEYESLARSGLIVRVK